MTAAVLTRHELLWVLEQCGADAWPYPLRAVAWDAETEDETGWHRRSTEDGLRRRGLLQPAPARLLLAVGELVRDWHVAVDLVHRAFAAPRAVAGLAAPGSGRPAALLGSSAHADDPVRVELVAPERLAEAVVATVPAVAAGAGPEVAIAIDALGDPGDRPATRRSVAARRGVTALVDTATGWGQLGVAARAGRAAAPVRPAAPTTWLDGPHGRWRVRHDRASGTTRALLDPVDAAGLAALARTTAGGALGPGPTGRSTA